VSATELDAVNDLVESHVGVRLRKSGRQWVAIDGKTLRGVEEQSEQTLLAVRHTDREILAQRRLSGPKAAEVPAARKLVRETGLGAEKVTLDALHLNPETTAQIHGAGGTYVIQIKENQPKLLAQVKTRTETTEPIGTVSTTDRGHGRLEIRQGALFDLEGMALHERWHESGLSTLIVMDRETQTFAQDTTSTETSYYVSNQAIRRDQEEEHVRIVGAIRHHWGVEADNYIRDVTFREDLVRTRNGNQGQIMSCLRTLAMRLFRKAHITNFQAATENFADTPTRFLSFLVQTGFL